MPDLPSRLTILDNSIRAVGMVSGATDALPINSANTTVIVQSTGVDAMTLAQPALGPLNIGDDGRELLVIDDGGHAHTITTASNGIVPSHHLATFNGTRGSYVKFKAFNGLWYPIASSGVTIS
jgi:hypothetical protein